ncbi:MAG: hypothetical protein IPO07_02565 [Haliscomenobacter sp.]|nr:hypothetical protein [Haliscomenobacter sp.]
MILLLSITLKAQMDQTAQRFAATITAEDLKNHLFKLTSAEFEGRETGTEGQRLAANYLASQMKSWNLPAIGEAGSYFQYITFTNQSWRKIEMKDADKELRHLWDYYAYPGTNPKQFDGNFEDAVFLGFGIDAPEYSDYKGVDVAGKLVVVYDGEPMHKINPGSVATQHLRNGRPIGEKKPKPPKPMVLLRYSSSIASSRRM